MESQEGFTPGSIDERKKPTGVGQPESQFEAWFVGARPNFDETSHGYRNFNELLEDAQRRSLLMLEKDAKSGGYLIIGFGPEA